MPEPRILKTAKIQAALSEPWLTQDVLTYGDAGMPPVLRMRKGQPFAARLVNGIDDPTTIHWHGLRILNNMDGVPFLIPTSTPATISTIRSPRGMLAPSGTIRAVIR